MTYTMTKNEQFNSFEITFDGKPCEAIRDALKALRFRWHGMRRVWYGYADEETIRAALDGVNGSTIRAEVQNSKQNSRPAEQHETRETEDGRGWYDKTSFRIHKGGECVYTGRYDLGDNDGGLIQHISANAANRDLDEDERAVIEWIRTQAGISSPLPAPAHVATIAEQITAADLQPGEAFTMLYIDQWINTALTVAAKMASASACEYAQYSDAARIEYTPAGKRKPQKLYITPGMDCAIFRGILPDVPDNIKYTDCDGSGMMRRVNYSGEGAREYMKNAIEYYKSIGFVPVFDTVSEPEQSEPVESLDDSSVEYIAYYS